MDFVNQPSNNSTFIDKEIRLYSVDGQRLTVYHTLPPPLSAVGRQPQTDSL